MSELKTQPTDTDVSAFLDGIADEAKRRDCFRLVDIMRDATGDQPRLWGSNIIGFGSVPYAYASGRKGTWFKAGFSPRKQNLTLYLFSGFEQRDELLSRLGKHSTGKACVYIKRLDDIDVDVLKRLVVESVASHEEDGS